MAGDTFNRAESFDATEILEGLWLGAMPSTQAFIEALRHLGGISAVVSFQTDVDLLTLGFDWGQMRSLLRRGGIEKAVQVPIRDFDQTSLARALPEAVEAVWQLRRQGEATYLHCTAGLNRSPTVAIAYLVSHEGFDLERAWAHVHARRRVLPLREALERWLEDTTRSGDELGRSPREADRE